MSRLVGAVATVLALLASVLIAPAAQAQLPAASGAIVRTSLTGWNAGDIINDTVFFDKGTMSQAQIQRFLAEKVPTCASGSTCLKDWYDTSRSTTADAMCGAYSGGTRERASAIIFKVARACGINPQVLIVTLQKEQGLVTDTSPTEWQYTIAMGQGCPDTAACDEKYYGFFNQVYGAAWQFKRYANPPGTSQYFTWYAPGNTWSILYHPDRSCGSSSVYVANQATANLYYYTPYQPNAASLKAGYGEGNGCSSYGNRNFYNYFTDWFGSTHEPYKPCRQPASSELVSAPGEFVVNVAALNGRAAPSTACDPVKASLPEGTIVTRLKTWEDWSLVRIDLVKYWVYSAYLSPNTPVDYETTRLAGANRYQTAVAVSQAAYPDGADTVFLASGEVFPDALAAGAAAGHTGAGLLLTRKTTLPETVVTELTRLGAGRIVIVGGTDRIGVEIDAALAVLLPDASVERIAGSDRYDTSRLLAAEFFPGATSAYVVTGRKFPDAVSAAGLGGATGRPVLLVDGFAERLGDSTLEMLSGSTLADVIIAGDESSVSAGVEEDLSGAGLDVTRYAGSSRYETSLLLGDAAYPSGSTDGILATGTMFPDALTGAVLAAQRSAPLFLSRKGCMSGDVKDWFIDADAERVTLIGGTPSLSEDVANSVRC